MATLITPVSLRLYRPVFLAALLATCIACEQVATGRTGELSRSPRALSADTVDFDALFSPATRSEIAAVQADWASRDVSAREVVEEAEFPVSIVGGPGVVRVFSHSVGDVRHNGAVLVPTHTPARPLGVVVMAHGGDRGINAATGLAVMDRIGERARNFLFVVPSFRSEALSAGGVVYRSTGAPSHWDYDVDDALALLNVALENVPVADPRHIAVLGTSRGGGVALLIAARDPRIGMVAEMAGPTDFFDPWVRGLFEEALRGERRQLTGLRFMDESFLQPLARGEITPAQFRIELVRRSPVLWARRLPPVQVHHGLQDTAVPPSQAETLIQALAHPARQALGDEACIYSDLGHSTALMDHAALATFLMRAEAGGDPPAGESACAPITNEPRQR